MILRPQFKTNQMTAETKIKSYQQFELEVQQKVHLGKIIFIAKSLFITKDGVIKGDKSFKIEDCLGSLLVS
jgi:hypothetical protein